METTTDGFLDNAFRVVQPKRGGHRSGLDAMLLSATVPARAGQTVADFGAGSGAAGLAVAHRCSGANVLLVECHPQMVELARRSCAANSHLAPRSQVLEADVLAQPYGKLASTFDHVIANPPFNDRTMQPSPDAMRSKAHAGTDLRAWIDRIVASISPDGTATLIARPDASDMVDTGTGKHVTILPVAAKEGTRPIRVLIRIRKSAGTVRARTLAPLILHQATGAFTDEVEAILRGRASIHL